MAESVCEREGDRERTNQLVERFLDSRGKDKVEWARNDKKKKRMKKIKPKHSVSSSFATSRNITKLTKELRCKEQAENHPKMD